MRASPRRPVRRYPASVFCPRCGAESPDDVRYCSACGAELPKRRDDDRDGAEAGAGATRGERVRARLRRLVGRSRKERVVSGITALLVVVAVVAFIRLDPAEDDETSAARDALDASCVAAKAQVVDAANALSGPGGAGQYAVLVVVAMLDLRDAASASAVPGEQDLEQAAFDAAVAAGRFGRVAREGGSQDEVAAALEQSTDALDGLSRPTEDLELANCAGAAIDGGS